MPNGTAPNPGPTDPKSFEKPDPKLAVRKETKKWLVGIGVGLVTLAVVLMALSWVAGEKTTETTKGPSTPTAKNPTTKTTKAKKGPSEGLLTALIGSGAALVLVGFLYGRISSVKLPGGVDVGLTTEEDEAATKKTLESLPPNTDNATAAKAIQTTRNAVLAAKANRAVTIPQEQISVLAESSAEAVADS